MAKDIKFNIKLTIDGKEHVVTASTKCQTACSRNGDSVREAIEWLEKISGSMTIRHGHLSSNPLARRSTKQSPKTPKFPANPFHKACEC